ncbi:MAG: hypothetical protein ABIG35_00770, partial [Pseudomonadota bacterium]
VPCATRQAGRLARTRLRLKHGKPKAPGPPALLSASHGDPKGVHVQAFCPKKQIPTVNREKSLKMKSAIQAPKLKPGLFYRAP